MAWRVEFSEGAQKNLERLELQEARRVLSFLSQRVVALKNPRQLGEPLKGSRLGELWRWRVGPLRIIANIEEKTLTLLIVKIGHRKEVYR